MPDRAVSHTETIRAALHFLSECKLWPDCPPCVAKKDAAFESLAALQTELDEALAENQELSAQLVAEYGIEAEIDARAEAAELALLRERRQCRFPACVSMPLAEKPDYCGMCADAWRAESAEESLAAAERALETAREALSFYADEGRYRRQPTPDAERGHYPEWTPVLDDAGHRARAALAGVPVAAAGREPDLGAKSAENADVRGGGA